MGPAYHKGVPLLGVPENPIDHTGQFFFIIPKPKQITSIWDD